MKKRRTNLTGIGDAFLNERAAPSQHTPASPIRAITKSLEILANGPGPELIPSLLARSDGPSIAPKILAFATGETASCSGGRSCARLYLALQGMAVPLRHTTTGMDLTRLEWWLQAMAEHATGRWGGDADGVKAIAAAQPETWEQAQAATAAWKETQQQQEMRLQSLEPASLKSGQT